MKRLGGLALACAVSRPAGLASLRRCG